MNTSQINQSVPPQFNLSILFNVIIKLQRQVVFMQVPPMLLGYHKGALLALLNWKSEILHRPCHTFYTVYTLSQCQGPRLNVNTSLLYLQYFAVPLPFNGKIDIYYQGCHDDLDIHEIL